MSIRGDIQRLHDMRARADRMIERIMSESRQVPEDLRGLFLGIVWRGVRDWLLGRHPEHAADTEPER